MPSTTDTICTGVSYAYSKITALHLKSSDTGHSKSHPTPSLAYLIPGVPAVRVTVEETTHGGTTCHPARVTDPGPPLTLTVPYADSKPACAASLVSYNRTSSARVGAETTHTLDLAAPISWTCRGSDGHIALTIDCCPQPAVHRRYTLHFSFWTLARGLEVSSGDNITILWWPTNDNSTPTTLAGYAMLESNTPVECTQIHHQESQSEKKSLQKLPPTLPMPKILGSVIRSPPPYVETRPRNSSLVAMLDGPAPGQAKAALGGSGLATSGVAGLNSSHSSFLPSGSALNMRFHPSMTNMSNMSRPSRLMNKTELNELMDQLWKGSISGGLGKALVTSAVSSEDCANPRAPGQLSFFTKPFNTSRSISKRSEAATPPGSSGAWRDSMAFIPLPRESVAMMVDAVRVSALEDDEKCRA
ncbi:hypothetical protein ON010_g9426 [Phytophthora cinnamomi]|nr:hypothetical protein ON010_g9426 [Phytophthora cinnamomi]